MIPRLYLITDRSLFNSEDVFIEVIEKALKAGLRSIQLREKDLPTRSQLDLAYKLRAITNLYNAQLFINDRVDIALCVGADGVHLPQSSMPPNVVRKIVKDNMLIGVSTHSLEEALSAQNGGADFITFGPIFRTPSKLQYGEPVGLSALAEVRRNIKVPILGIGGIDLDNIESAINKGAEGIALIRGILSAQNIDETVKKYLMLLGEKR